MNIFSDPVVMGLCLLVLAVVLVVLAVIAEHLRYSSNEYKEADQYSFPQKYWLDAKYRAKADSLADQKIKGRDSAYGSL